MLVSGRVFHQPKWNPETREIFQTEQLSGVWTTCRGHVTSFFLSLRKIRSFWIGHGKILRCFVVNINAHSAVLDPEKKSLNGLFSLLNIRHPQKFFKFSHWPSKNGRSTLSLCAQLHPWFLNLSWNHTFSMVG